MSQQQTVLSVAAALAEVEQWKGEQLQRHQAELVEVDQEVSSLEAALGNLQSQLDALRSFREEVANRAQGVSGEELARSHKSMFQALASQVGALQQRAGEVQAASELRHEAFEKQLAQSEFAPLFVEYKQFRSSIEPTLAGLPDSYRNVILEHHNALSKRLRDHVAGALGSPVTLSGASPLEIDVVFSLDPVDGEPDLLVCVVPAPPVALEQWPDRPEDLSLCFASRVVQAVYAACKAKGLMGAQAIVGGHMGVIVIEVEVAGAGKALQAELDAQIKRVVAEAPELKAANVVARPRKVAADMLLLSAEEGEGEEDAA